MIPAESAVRARIFAHTYVPTKSNMSQPTGPASAPDTQTASPAARIGWLFVPQYYTLLHQDPNRLYCFYTKKSTMVHGTEDEEVAPSFGQQVRAHSLR